MKPGRKRKRICARPGCNNPIVREQGVRGRGYYYCSDACKPSRRAIRICKAEGCDKVMGYRQQHCDDRCKLAKYGKCLICGGVLASRKRITCSYTCGAKLRTQKGEELRKRERTVVCKVCGISFIKPNLNGAALKGKQRSGIYCSKKCMGRATTIHAEQNRNLVIVLFFHIIERFGTPSYMVESRKVYFPTCEICGELFTSKMVQARMCSTKCRSNAYWLRVAPHIYEPRKCKECGEMFAPGYGDHRIAYCSKQCGKRYVGRQTSKNVRQRARYFGVEYEHVNIRKVFDRDGWSCQICGRKTPETMRGKHKPTSPELDHRVPMANGGGHLYSNVQCACRRCNSEKSNYTSVGQLPMFGVGEVPYSNSHILNHPLKS